MLKTARQSRKAGYVHENLATCGHCPRSSIRHKAVGFECTDA